jgi:hypothetical protein
MVEDICSHLLILDHGQRRFFGPVADAREAFDNLQADATLEEVFFRATESVDHGETDKSQAGSPPPAPEHDATE